MNYKRVNVKMSFCKETFCERNKSLTLVGSQVNLTPRSDNSVFGSYYGKSCKLCSPSASGTQCEYKPKHRRPKSADCSGVHVHRCHSILQWPFEPSGKQKYDDSLTVSHLTDSSSKLLQNLIDIPSYKTSTTIQNSLIGDNSPKASNTFKVKESSTEKFSQLDNSYKLSTTESSEVIFKDEEPYVQFEDKFCIKDKVQELFPESAEEKTVRFSDSHHLCGELPEKKYDFKCLHPKEICCRRSKSELALACGKRHFRKTFDNKKLSELQTLKKNKSECDILKVVSPNREDYFGKKFENKDLEAKSDEEIKLSVESESEELQQPVENSDDGLKTKSPSGDVDPTNSTSGFAEEKDQFQEKKNLNQNEEAVEQARKPEEAEQNLNTSQKINLSDSTYEEIVNLLQTLEDEDSDSLNLKDKEESAVDVPVDAPEGKLDYFNVVSSYLEEIELNENKNYVKPGKWNCESFSSPRLEELLNKSSVELAHEVFSLKIQVEDQKKGIKLLKDTLAEMKEAKKQVDIEHQEAVQKINSEAEVLVQRHQKFIKQLLTEKNNLNETVSKLVKDLKSGEEKYKRNLKAIEEKHLIEIKRAKETQAVADKIKREKWMEIKTQKIKEMTVKGLEPELSRMAARQQEEIMELRNLHKAEIEALELRAARRTSDLMDELRAELTKEKERAVAKEVAAVRAALEKEFDEERNTLQQHNQNLKENLRKQEEKLLNKEEELKDMISTIKQEEEKKKHKLEREHEEKIEEIRRQHLVELRILRESLEAEREVFINNYKKKQAAKFLEREAELHQQYKKERDKEIEIIIETLENETAQIQAELTREGEIKLKRLREKMEAELKEIEGNEAALKVKLSETKAKLSEKEDFITELNSQIRQLQTEVTVFKKSCEEMSAEKAKMKELIRGEFEETIANWVRENENLEKEIAAIKEQHAKELVKKDQINLQNKHEMQKELTRVYSRIKTAVSKKEEVIESLRQENVAVNQRCQQLELMLDQQRRNLLL